MNCDNGLRHVCVKDLENYLKRDDYFSSYTEEELKVVQKNLGMLTIDSLLIEGDYDAIYELKNKAKLKLGYTYVINNFRSIYFDKNNNICGLDLNVPSKEYYVLLHPSSESSFDSRVSLYRKDDPDCSKWVVEYDITPVTLLTMTNRGTITFLKDTNNNYAYYDFKNIKFKKTLSELKQGPLSFDSDTYCYTFGGTTDLSETIVKNAHLEKGATGNIFFGTTTNVTLAANCHDNIFFKDCENCIFDYGTYSNYFKDSVINCKGSVHDKAIASITTGNNPKTFLTLGNVQGMDYIDSATQTHQFVEV